MPYSSIKDAPKSLVGAGLSLAQINIWSKIYDSAKVDKAREPAAVAWSQFKKLYRKVEDKWVKRAVKLMKISTPLNELSKWPSDWNIPEEITTIRLSDKKEIEIPYIIKDRIILKEGVANGLFYPGEELEPCVAVLNEKPDIEDVEARKRTSLFWDHDDACKNWLGEIKNCHWDAGQKAIVADIYLVDKSAAEKTHYQLEVSDDKLSRWGISPRVKINEQDGRATNIQFVSQALVLDPAGGPKLMLEKNKDSEEEFYEDLSLEKDEETMQFANVDLEMEKLAEEFNLTKSEIANFGEEQLKLLRSVPKTKNTLQDDNEKFDCECIKCGYKVTSEEHCADIKCPKCGAQMRRVERPGYGQPSSDDTLVEKFDCSCIECGWTTTSEDHCNTLKCERCGGQMRRASRPGPGQPSPEEQSPIRNYIENFTPILKIDNDERIVKMVVLEPEVADNHGHIVSEKEIQSAMYLWMEKYKNTEVMHRDRAGNLFPMEEKILSPDDDLWKYGWNKEFAILECYQSPADYFEGEELIRKGSWVLTLRVNDKDIWQKIKDKELTGASIGGHGALSTEVV